MSCEITELEQLRHVLRNKAMCMTSDIKAMMEALTEGLPDDHKTIATKTLMKHEGFRSRPYKCTAKKWTIGFGINLETQAIPHEVALHWLEYKVEEYDTILNNKLSFYSELTDNRKAVLIDMIFNLGCNGLLHPVSGFPKTLKLIEQGKYKEASIEMLDSKWAKEDVGQRAITLSKIMETG